MKTKLGFLAALAAMMVVFNACNSTPPETNADSIPVLASQTMNQPYEKAKQIVESHRFAPTQEPYSFARGEDKIAFGVSNDSVYEVFGKQTYKDWKAAFSGYKILSKYNWEHYFQTLNNWNADLLVGENLKTYFEGPYQTDYPGRERFIEDCAKWDEVDMVTETIYTRDNKAPIVGIRVILNSSESSLWLDFDPDPSVYYSAWNIKSLINEEELE